MTHTDTIRACCNRRIRASRNQLRLERIGIRGDPQHNHEKHSDMSIIHFRSVGDIYSAPLSVIDKMSKWIVGKTTIWFNETFFVNKIAFFRLH